MRVTIASLTRPLAAFTLHDGYDRASWRAPMVQALTGLEGWLEGVTPRFEDPIVPTGHGSYGPADIYLASRIVTVRFAARAMFRHGGSSLMVAQFDDLVASLVGEWVEIRVEDASGVRTASGYVGAVPVRERISEWAARYSLIMNCPDPLKYGTTVAYAAAGGAVDVRNEGTGGVFPVFRMSGAVRSFSAVLGDARIEWSGTATGLVLDAADMVPRNTAGAEVGSLIWGQPIVVPPGESRLTVASNRPVSVEVTPGWK